jgi:hypothetical protein
MSGAGRLHSQTSAPASDVVVDTIPDRETEVNHYYSPQWKKSNFIDGAGVEPRSLHLAVPIPNMMLRTRHRTTLLVRPPECPRRRHRRTQDASVLALKFGRETRIVRLSFGGCFVDVDVFF